MLLVDKALDLMLDLTLPIQGLPLSQQVKQHGGGTPLTNDIGIEEHPPLLFPSSEENNRVS